MSKEAMKLALDNLIAEYHMESSSFAKRVDDIFKEELAEQPSQQEPVAEVKAKMTGGNTCIATVIHEIYNPMRHPFLPGDLLYASPVNQVLVGWMHSRTGLFYSLSVKPDESGLLDEPTDTALPIYTPPPAQKEHFDHTTAANAALRDAQNRSYQIAKSTQPAQQREPDLSGLKPSTQEVIKGWIEDGTFIERAIGAMQEQEAENMRLEKMAAPQPAQRKPLTAREIELIDGMIEVQLDHAARCDNIPNRVMAEKQKGWDMERVELLRKLKEKNT